MTTFRSLRRDLERAWPGAGALRLMWYSVVDSGSQAVVLIRLQSRFEAAHLKIAAKLIRRINFVMNGIDWVEGARAGGGLVLRHPAGIVVGHRVKIGRDVTLMQGVTLGQKGLDTDGSVDNPRIGDRVMIGANAVVIGGIAVGEDSIVGAGSVVIRDVERGALVAGNPARLIRAGV